MNQDVLKSMQNKLKSDIPPRYAEFFLHIFSLNSDEEIYEYLKNEKINANEYYAHLYNFEKNYSYAMEECIKLEKIYATFYEKRINKNACSFLLFKTILDSGYSVEEYCSLTGESIYDINTIIVKYKNSDYAKKLLEVLKKRDQSNFYNLIDNIILDMKREDYDVIDYYMQTRLTFDDFMKIARPRINDIELLKKVGKFCNVNKMLSRNYIGTSVLEGTLIIDGIEITKEQKEECFNFLKSNNIPLWTYKAYLKKQMGNKIKKLERKDVI